MVTKAEIVEMLKTNDRAVARALVVLNERQTRDEQVQESTKHHNGQGFRPCHARMGTSTAGFFSRNGYLSPKQVAYWRALDKTGKMRIEIYAGQLLEIASEKAARELKRISTPQPAKVALEDYGNLMEEKMVLEEMSGQSGVNQDAIFDRLMQIQEQLEEYARCEYKMSRDLQEI